MTRLTLAIFLVILFTSCASDPNNKGTEKDQGVQLMQSPVDSVSAEPYLFTDIIGQVYLSWITKDL